MRVVYAPKDRIYFRVNPENENELQWANRLAGRTPWQHAYTCKDPILGLEVDDASGHAIIITHKGSHRDYFISSGARAFNRIALPSGNRIVLAYKF